MKTDFNLVVLPGDGVGKEVIALTLKLLPLVEKNLGVKFNCKTIPGGGEYYLRHEQEWPDGSFELCKDADAILLGAVGYQSNGKPVMTIPGKPYDNSQLAGYAQVIGNRKKLDLYANVRPIKLYPGLKIPISNRLCDVWQPDEVDYVVVKENTEDAYTGESWKLDKQVITPIQISKYKTERIVRFAFKLARKRNKYKRVTCVDKSNIVGAHRYFREIFDFVGKNEFSDIERTYSYVDTFTYQQLQNPKQFDVVVAPNLIGDVISESGVISQGGLGLAPSGNIGENHAMFEPIHGSALDQVGLNTVNPMASVLSLSMMFDWLGNKFDDERLNYISRLIEQAVINTINRGVLTKDLVFKNSFSSSEVMDSICSEFIKSLEKREN